MNVKSNQAVYQNQRHMTRGDDPAQSNKIATRLHEIKEQGGLKRQADVGVVDVTARTVQLSFSSEAAEVERWFGIEVLSHAKGAVDLTRLQDGAPVLWMHKMGDQRGVVESASIDKDKVGRAVVRMSRSPAGDQLFQDIQDGIVTKVSVGYLVNGMKLTEERADNDVYTVTDWLPYEISFVSVAADNDVGVGRRLENPQEEKKPVAAKNANIRKGAGSTNDFNGNRIMNEKILRDGSGNLVRAKVGESGEILEVLEVLEKAGDDSQRAQQRGQDSERDRVRGLTELGKAYGANDLALELIGSGKTAEDMQRELLTKFAKERSKTPMADQVRGSEIGLTDKEVRQFSLMRAVRAMATPNDKRFQQEAAFEFEVSQAAAEKAGKQARGIMIPADILNRSFSTTTPAGGTGANLVATNLLADSFIDLLRNRTWAMKRCTTMGGLVGNVDIPRQKGATQAYWVGEGGAPSESEPATDQIHFSPKSLAAYTDITRRLMLQSTPDAEHIVRNDIIRVMALAMDKAVLYGTGAAGQPLGLKGQTGIHAVQLAGANPTYAEYVAMETAIAAANADVESMAYVINAAARGNAKSVLKFAVNGASTIWEPGNTINGYAAEVTNQITAGDAWFGNWADFVIAMWSGLDLTVDPYSLSTSGATRLVMFQDVDMNIRHTESFTYAASTATPVP